MASSPTALQSQCGGCNLEDTDHANPASGLRDPGRQVSWGTFLHSDAMARFAEQLASLQK